MPALTIDLQCYQDEETLVAALRQHEPDACTCLVKTFASIVYAQAYRLMNDADEAETVLQTTFIRACEKINHYEGRGALGTRLYRIATNEALMLLRRKRPQVSLEAVAETLSADDIPQQLQPWSLDPARFALDHELREQLEAALATLSDSLRTVFVLRELQGLSTEETASTLGIGTSAVKVRLHRARLHLREVLADYFTVEDMQ